MNVIGFDKVRFSYDRETAALGGIDLQIGRGEFVCVLGGNGSGKSTLAKHVNALLVPDEGEVRVLGRATSDPNDVFFIRSKAGMVFQSPDDQLVASVIEDDVAFGPENLGVPAEDLRARVTEALTQVGLQGFEKKETAALSGGQKQRVAIAGVLAMDPEILVLDEASALLDPRGRAGLLRICRELNDRGLTIVLITHFMDEAVHADRVVALDGGRVALSGAPGDVLADAGRLAALGLEVPFAVQMGEALREHGVPIEPTVDVGELEKQLASMMGVGSTGPAGRRGCCAPEAVQPSVQHPDRPGGGGGGEPVIAFEGVSYTYKPAPRSRRVRDAVIMQAKPARWGSDPAAYWALHDLSFSVREGEFFGIAGHTGSGKSTLIQLAGGLLQPTVGQVRINGVDMSDRGAARAVRRDVGVVFQYPERQLFAATVFDDVAFGPRNLGLSPSEVSDRVFEALSLVHLDPDELCSRSPFALSGGQQRRVAFAGVLAMRPAMLLLDEPLAGLDPQARSRLKALISELHDERGMTVAIVSHNMDDLAGLCDRVLVLNQGGLFALGSPANVFSDADGLREIGLGVPNTLRFAIDLGLDGLVAGIPSVSDLARLVASERRVREGAC